MKPWKENGAAISSEEVNFLVFRYLQESGERFSRPIHPCTPFLMQEVGERGGGRAQLVYLDANSLQVPWLNTYFPCLSP